MTPRDTSGRPDTAAPAIELRGISKAFGPVQANKDISIRVMPGTIHGIIGENGAGKSTLMSILYGFYRADAGEIWINGTRTEITDSQAAIRAGIGMVFQHFKLVQNFTVLENIILGAEEGQMLNTSLSKARKELERLARDYELDVDPDALIEDLSVGHQQRVEILKALYRQADILILDEPTGVLTPDEADHLFRILKGLKEQGKTVILITHKLREIMEATDNVSVMRRGTMVATVKTAETSPEQLAELMVGRKVLLEVEKGPAKPGEVVLSVNDLRVRDEHKVERLKGVSFDIRAGEILGIAGVAGNGQSELLAALGGMQVATGQATLKGAPLPLSGAGSDGQSRRASGIAHVPEDRHHHGLILDFTAWENVAFGYFNDPGYQKNALFMDNEAIRADTDFGGEKLLGREPAEDRGGARDGTEPGAPSHRAADARGGHRRDRVHPQADHRAAGCRGGDPAGICGTGRDHEPFRPHCRDVRRSHHGLPRPGDHGRTRVGPVDGRGDGKGGGGMRTATRRPETHSMLPTAGHFSALAGKSGRDRHAGGGGDTVAPAPGGAGRARSDLLLANLARRTATLSFTRLTLCRRAA